MSEDEDGRWGADHVFGKQVDQSSVKRVKIPFDWWIFTSHLSQGTSTS